MTYREEIKTELHEMADLGIISKGKSLRACAIVDCSEYFKEEDILSVSDAANLAVELS